MDYAAAQALYDKLVATAPRVERKGATVPYTSLNGHMFSALHTVELKPYFDASIAYVTSLKPKATTTKKPPKPTPRAR